MLWAPVTGRYSGRARRQECTYRVLCLGSSLETYDLDLSPKTDVEIEVNLSSMTNPVVYKGLSRRMVATTSTVFQRYKLRYRGRKCRASFPAGYSSSRECVSYPGYIYLEPFVFSGTSCASPWSCSVCYGANQTLSSPALREIQN